MQFSQLNTYLVGGAVRDQLLNRPVKDKDYVVVGATVETMLNLGFKAVGKDFPVFLHPQTKEEYALARTERKQGKGYKGFICYAEPDVTLEQDLQRRDLTINAIAQDKNGQYIDPVGGIADIKNRILRHVSSAFVEDPLRVLRVARFAARYHDLGFTIAPETLELMREISSSGELACLSAERIWQEMHASLQLANPAVFFQVLKACDALKSIWPELNNLFGVPNPPKWHPEIDSGIHTMMVLEQSAKLSQDAKVRFAALCHDLGKGLTPKAQYPSHRGHEKSGIALVEQSCDRFKVSNQFRQLAKLACEFHLHCHKAFELKPKTILKLFDSLDLWRNPHITEQFLRVCQADFLGRTGFENKPYPQAKWLQTMANQLRTISAKPFIAQGLQGKAIKQAMHNARLEMIKSIKNDIAP